MWVLYAIMVHILLLGSVFQIYFRSPVIRGLKPRQSYEEAGYRAPAKRLVLIVTDGLRAQSFFENNCDNVPAIRDIFLHQGLVGVSRTHVPTESRPGHIALIAGLYEDPSAITKGWKANPVDFDTLFNRSDYTYAWGDSDVIDIFSRLSTSDQPMYFDTYDAEVDFTGKDKTYEHDEWVFERVPKFLRRKQQELQKQERVVFFLHLLGLDSAGHLHKPGSKLFQENLNYTQNGIAEIYKTFEEIFPDNKTVYLMTSDHGMTDGGSHGSGDPTETDTPFVLWGAGVTPFPPNTGNTFKAGSTTLRLQDLEQAHLTPLMSALIGLVPPVNNFGIMPLGYMDTGPVYESHAVYTNARQLIAQYEVLLWEHMQGFFSPYIRAFPLTTSQINDFHEYIIDRFEENNFKEVMQVCTRTMHMALEGIDYYHGYYRNMMLTTTTAAFIGWIVYLLLILMPDLPRDGSLPIDTSLRITLLPFILHAASILSFAYLQKLPFGVGFYLFLPVPIWLLALHGRTINEMRMRFSLPIVRLLLLLACTELLVFSFFDRRLISAGYIIYSALDIWRQSRIRGFKFFTRLTLAIILVIFPWLPLVGHSNIWLFFLGIILILVRPHMAKTRITSTAQIVTCIAMANGAVSVIMHTNQIGVPMAMRLVSWVYVAYALIAIVSNESTSFKYRLEYIFYNLHSIYCLLTISYESAFIYLLAFELLITLADHQHTPAVSERKEDRHKLWYSFRLAFVILLYTLFSFFGSGNSASISSFDPNVMRCFLSTFVPFAIMALIIFKLVIPVVLIVSIVFALSGFARAHERQIFVCMLLICNVMGLNFLFFVRNRGSWLEIGSSLSHFVIMEVTTVVLVLITCIAKMFLHLSFFGIKMK